MGERFAAPQGRGQGAPGRGHHPLLLRAARSSSLRRWLLLLLVLVLLLVLLLLLGLLLVLLLLPRLRLASRGPGAAPLAGGGCEAGRRLEAGGDSASRDLGAQPPARSLLIRSRPRLLPQ